MTFYINAWLDRADPFISLHNRRMGTVVARLDSKALMACLEQGDLCVTELCDPDPQVQQEVVKCILLAQCALNMRCQLNHLFDQCLEQCNEQCNALEQPSVVSKPVAMNVVPFRLKRQYAK